MKFFSIRPLVIFLFVAFWIPLQADDLSIVKRVHNHLLINDYSSALSEVKQGMGQFPNSKALHEALILVYAKTGEEKRMLALWDTYTKKFPQENINRDLIEAMSWGVIQKGAESTALMTKVIGLLAAFLTQDVKGIELIQKNMNNSNSVIRALSVELASHCFDDRLRNEMLKLFQQEKSFNVRLEVIRSLGKMKIAESRGKLEAIIADDKSLAEEKAAAIQSLVSLLDVGDRDYVVRLARSNRAGLRLLACQVVQYFDLKADIDQIIPLLNDNRAEVRAEALRTLGLLRISSVAETPVSEFFVSKLSDSDPKVAITAAWGLTLYDPERGQKAFVSWFKHEKKDIRLYAAAALVATGKHGIELAQKIFFETGELYVRLNLALGLISQRKNVQEACDALYQGIMQSRDRWMMDEEGSFSVLTQSNVKHQAAIPQYPEAVNQSVRLEILGVLAMMKYDKAQEAMKTFLLQQRNDSVTGMAVALLLTEGDEGAVEVAKGLLNDKDAKVRLQAALILALWGRDESIINFLQDSYATAARAEKEKILEGLGTVASESSIPFLLETLKEPYQILRLIAAFGLIQCLNH